MAEDSTSELVEQACSALAAGKRVTVLAREPLGRILVDRIEQNAPGLVSLRSPLGPSHLLKSEVVLGLIVAEG